MRLAAAAAEGGGAAAALAGARAQEGGLSSPLAQRALAHRQLVLGPGPGLEQPRRGAQTAQGAEPHHHPAAEG